MRTLLVPALAGAVIVVTGAVGMALSAPDDPADRQGEQRTETRGGEEGEPASERGRERREAAREFVTAKQEWLACVAEARSAQEEAGPLDREEACGEKPRPAPAMSRPDGGHGVSGEARARPDHARGHGRAQAPGQLKKKR